MRGLLLMSITGAALYGLLMLTNHFLTAGKARVYHLCKRSCSGRESHPTFLGEQPSCIGC